MLLGEEPAVLGVEPAVTVDREASDLHTEHSHCVLSDEVTA